MLDHKDFMIGLEDLKALRAKKRKLEEEVKEVNGEIAALVFDLVEYMQETDQLQVKIGDIGTCSLTSTKSYSVDDPLAFEEWMAKNDDINVVMAIHAKKVHGYYKEKLENGEELPPGIKTFVKNNITIRG
jgi:hypothetical protein